jgi:hypothetical protein
MYQGFVYVDWRLESKMANTSCSAGYQIKKIERDRRIPAKFD